jgi:hypothetical protein
MISSENMNPNARIWIYQANRALDSNEINWVNEQLSSFSKDWSSHGSGLKAHAQVLGSYFLLFVVDNEQTNASGCSIDKSVRFVKDIGSELKIDFFNRLKILKENPEGNQELISFSKMSEFPKDFVFDILVDRLGDLETDFKIGIDRFLKHKQLF